MFRSLLSRWNRAIACRTELNCCGGSTIITEKLWLLLFSSRKNQAGFFKACCCSGRYRAQPSWLLRKDAAVQGATVCRQQPSVMEQYPRCSIQHEPADCRTTPSFSPPARCAVVEFSSMFSEEYNEHMSFFGTPPFLLGCSQTRAVGRKRRAVFDVYGLPRGAAPGTS